MKNHIFCPIKNYVGIVSNDNIYQMYQIIYDKISQKDGHLPIKELNSIFVQACLIPFHFITVAVIMVDLFVLPLYI